jgi:hypothetical protein
VKSSWGLLVGSTLYCCWQPPGEVYGASRTEISEEPEKKNMRNIYHHQISSWSHQEKNTRSPGANQFSLEAVLIFGKKL